MALAARFRSSRVNKNGDQLQILGINNKRDIKGRYCTRTVIQTDEPQQTSRETSKYGLRSAE